MREDHTARRCRRVAEAREFFHQIGIGQTVETVALNSLGVEASRNRQQLGDTRHGVVKRRVKTGHLGQFRMTLAERLDQFDLAGQMIRVVRRDAMQFIHQLRRDLFRLGMRHAMHHSVSHGLDRSEGLLRFEPINQETRGRFVIGGGEAATGLRLSIRVVKRQIRPAQADAVNLPIKPLLQRFAHLVQRELDARRAAVDRQDTGLIEFLRHRV